MNIFKQFIRSIYSPKDIASFRSQGIGKTILYLLLLSMIASIPSLIYLSKGLNEAIHTLTITMEEEVPTFTISNNELQMDQTEPLIIDKKDLTIILDSTGTYYANNISTSGNTIALLKKGFVVVSAGQSQSFDYTTFGNITISKDEFTSFLQSFDSMIYVIIGVLVVMFLFFMGITKAIETLIFAIFGGLFARIIGRSLSYVQLWKITVYSTTLPVIFFVVMDSIQTAVPNGNMLYWFVSLFIVFLSLKEIPKEKAEK